MLFDIKKALNVPFSDENWTKKIGIAALLYLPAFISSLQFDEKHLLTRILYTLASFIITGYAVLAANNEVNEEQVILPEWNFGSSVINSFKIWLLNFLWFLAMTPFVFLLVLISIFNPAFLIISVVFGIALFLLYMLVINISQSIFLEKLMLKDAFDFKNIILFVKNYSAKYFYYIIVILLMAIVYGIIAGVMTATFSYLINNAFGFYVAYIVNIFLLISAFNLLAQIIKNIKKEQRSFLEN